MVKSYIICSFFVTLPILPNNNGFQAMKEIKKKFYPPLTFSIQTSMLSSNERWTPFLLCSIKYLPRKKIAPLHSTSLPLFLSFNLRPSLPLLS